MRPFWPLAAFCLLLHLTTACKEIKLKFDLQRMVERELNKIPNNLSLSNLAPRHGEEDLCRHPAHHKGDGNQHHPRAWREGVSDFYSYIVFLTWLLPQIGECIDHKQFIRSTKTYSCECPFPFINHIH